MVRVVLKRVRAMFGAHRSDAQLDTEIREHLDRLAEDHERLGLSPAEARSAARRDFGGVDLTKERYRDQRGLPVIDSLAQSVRFAARGLRKSPGFTIATVLLLALAIGVNTAIFSLVDAVLLRALPYRQPERLVWASGLRKVGEGPFNVADFLDYRDRNRTLESIGAFGEVSSILTGDGDPVLLRGVRVTANIFDLLGASPLVGRTLEPEDDLPGAPPVVVVTEAMWRARLGADRGVVGRTLVLNGSPYQVVGVLPAAFLFPRSTPDYATSMAADRDPARTQHGGTHQLRVVGRLKPGVTPAQSQADLTAIARQLTAEHWENALKVGVRLVSLREAVLGSARDSLEVVVAAVSLLLLVVVVNVASSLLARATARRKELAVRAALGASRVQLLAQPIAENVLLAAAGGALGIAIARWVFPVLQAWNPATFPRAELAVVGGTAMGYAAALSALVVVLIAIAPAWQMPAGVMHTLRARGEASRLSRRTRTVLIVSEVALSFGLLLGASTMSQTLVRLLRVHPGFETRQLLAATLTLPRGRYDDAKTVQAFFDRAASRFRLDRRVQSWSAVSMFPLSGGPAGAPFRLKDNPVAFDRYDRTNYRFIEPDYFRTMQIAMRAGRDFSSLDTAATAGVGIVSDQFVRRFLAGRDPIGTHLIVKDDAKVGHELEIVGVVANVTQEDLSEPPAADLYLPLPQVPSEPNGYFTRGVTVVVRGNGGNPAQLMAAIKDHLLSAEAEAAVTIRPADDVMVGSLAPLRFLTTLMNLFAAFCVLLAAFGLYSVMSYITAQRFHEIAVRMAMGATSVRIARSVMGHAVALAILGMAIGTVLTMAAQRLAASAFEMRGIPVVPFASAAALLLTTIAVAAWLPAARAARINPAVSLRQE